MVRTLTLVLLLLALPAQARPPRLTLFISVDAMGSDLLLRSRPGLQGGLGQLLDRGAFYPYARYDYAKARTAPGHATLSTGANPWRHGIVDNREVDRATGKYLRAYHDPAHTPLESPTVGDDTSPANLLAETLADRLRVATRSRGKAVALSGKARAAIPLAGRLGQAYWYDDAVGGFVTSTWYLKAPPAWLKAFNARKLPDAAFGKAWTLLLPRAEYLGEDDRPHEGEDYGLGRTFPHPLTGGLTAPGPAFYKAFAVSPMANDVLVQAARAAIEGEKLGQDDVPDLLAVSFSATDAIFHQYGPHSWEMQDVMARLDRAMGELVAAAERAAGGRDNLLVVVAADHGGAAVPEDWASAGLPAKRVDPRELAKALTHELRAKLKVDVAVTVEELDVYLRGPGAEAGGEAGVALRRAAAEFLARQPDIATAVARDDLPTAPDVAGLMAPLRKGYYPERSGDVLLVLKPFHVMSWDTEGTNHGTPYAYDSNIPVVFAGKGVRPGTYAREISVTDVAPTVAALLELSLPASAEGTPRHEALTGAR
ncbi:alkaline phosphatase family protein [Myxococcaceae bacterium GXIMD 01537]